MPCIFSNCKYEAIYQSGSPSQVSAAGITDLTSYKCVQVYQTNDRQSGKVIAQCVQYMRDHL